MEKDLEILSKVNRVETPPFLFTRINQRIKSLQTDVATPKFKWAFAVVTIIILCLNFAAFVKEDKQTEQIQLNKTNASYSSSFENDIYNE